MEFPGRRRDPRGQQFDHVVYLMVGVPEAERLQHSQLLGENWTERNRLLMLKTV